jgi:Rrf2 family iron-sulfur cluster assembly transcriptional regulator
MRFSLSTEYAIHGLLFLALHAANTAIMLSEVAQALHVSEPSLRKVFQMLARHGLITSYRGIKGGYRLGMPAQQITLKDVVQVTEGASVMYQCMSTHQQCEPGSRCVIGSAFQEVEAQVSAALRNITIADLATRVREGSKEVRWFETTVHEPRQAQAIRLCSL